MSKKRNILDLEDDELNPMCPFGNLIGQYVNDGTRIGETLVRNDDGQYSASTLTFAMLISENVYKMVVFVERLIEFARKLIPRN